MPSSLKSRVRLDYTPHSTGAIATMQYFQGMRNIELTFRTQLGAECELIKRVA
jgi:hypothetical protein